LTGVLLRSHSPIASEPISSNTSQDDVFICPEESQFYSYCLERLLFQQCNFDDYIVEFGSGDGSPVINSLCRTQFEGTIHGYELNSSAYEIARSRINQRKLQHKYTVHNESFFDADRPAASCLIANPPYIPAPDDNICMPLLRGGMDGATITNQLLSLNYPTVMLLVSSYSNPVETVTHAIANGYDVADFMVTPLQFGYYSSESSVKKHIEKLRKLHKAFYSNNIYFLAGVLFKKHTSSSVNLATELLQVMTAL
jgi:methylase of polypeptide subunit release factors